MPQTSVGALFGPYDENLRHVEALLNVKIRTQGDALMVDGHPRDTARVERWVGQVSGLLGDGHSLSDTDIRTAAQLVSDNETVDLHEHFLKGGQLRHAGKRRITAKSANQRLYLDAIEQHDIVFGIGPAGTGKTYLAMAQAVSYLLAKKVARIVLARPAVEAGEKLGFLPGDLQEKVNPYLRPLYDALYDMLDVERAQRLLERGTIEVAPIAFMRGRTLNDAFVILDEAQNTTTEQMKMFLTRLGFGSKAVVTGDITQIDLPSGRTSGLIDAMRVVSGVEGIAFIRFDERDVVRHQLVQAIVKAYDAASTPAHALRRVADRLRTAMGARTRPAGRLDVAVLAPDGSRRPAGTGRVAGGRRAAPRPRRGDRRARERPADAHPQPHLSRRRRRDRRPVVPDGADAGAPRRRPGRHRDCRRRRRAPGRRRRPCPRHRAPGPGAARPAAPARLRSRTRRRRDGAHRAAPAAPRTAARRPDRTRPRARRAREEPGVTPLALFLLACAAVLFGTVSAAFSVLMRLSLRLSAERSDRDDLLGRYLDDPMRLFIPARIVLAIIYVVAGALLARVVGDAGRSRAAHAHRRDGRVRPGLRAPHPAAADPPAIPSACWRRPCRPSTPSSGCCAR